MVNVIFDKFFLAVEAQSVLVFKNFLNVIGVVKSFCIRKSGLSVRDVYPSLFFVVLAVNSVMFFVLKWIKFSPLSHTANRLFTMLSGIFSHLGTGFLAINFMAKSALPASANLTSWMKSRGLRMVGVKELSGSGEELFTGSTLFHGGSKQRAPFVLHQIA